MNKKKVVFKINQKKTALIIFVSAAFILLSSWLLLLPNSTDSLKAFLKITAAISGVLFFGIVLLVGIYKATSDAAGVIIDQKGIYDNSNAGSAGFISWNQITSISSKRVGNSQFVILFVSDSTKFENRGSILKRVLFKLNSKIYGTPFTISNHFLNCNFGELYHSIESFYELQKQD